MVSKLNRLWTMASINNSTLNQHNSLHNLQNSTARTILSPSKNVFKTFAQQIHDQNWWKQTYSHGSNRLKASYKRTSFTVMWWIWSFHHVTWWNQIAIFVREFPKYIWKDAMVNLKQSVSWFSLATFCEQEWIIVLFQINFAENLSRCASLYQLVWVSP
jgi:hypothetical protein